MFIKLLTYFLLSVFCVLLVKANEVEITDLQVDYVDPHYINGNKSVVKLVRTNSTYVATPYHWSIIRDFPKDTTLTTLVRRSATEDGYYQDYRLLASSVCNLNDPNRKLLPNFLSSTSEDGDCIKKGEYDFEDAEAPHFEKFLTEEEINGFYFHLQNQIRGSHNEILLQKVPIQMKSVNAM